MTSSVVVAGAADVVVQDHRPVRGGAGAVTVEPSPQDRGETGVAERADSDRPSGSRFHSFGFVGARQAQDAERRAGPCSGWRPRESTASISVAVLGPILAASPRKRSGVHSAKRRWAGGMCSGVVLWPRWERRMWLATRFPLGKTSTVVAVMRASSSVLASANGTL